jgi:hypothetical protein
MTPRQRLDLAMLHFEAAANDGDPGRAGLGFYEVLHARNALLAEEERQPLHAADDLDGGTMEAAAERTRARVLALADTDRPPPSQVPSRQDRETPSPNAMTASSVVRICPAGNL